MSGSERKLTEEARAYVSSPMYGRYEGRPYNGRKIVAGLLDALEAALARETKERARADITLGTLNAVEAREQRKDEALRRAERQRDRALSDRVAWERACHDSDARLAALIEHVGWGVAQPTLDRVDRELSRAK